MPSPFVFAGGTAKFPTRASSARLRLPPAPVLGPGRDPDAVYLLDSGVAYAFAHVDRLELLAAHYGHQLQFTQAVWAEWDGRAESDFWTGRPGETIEQREQREMHNDLRVAGRRLIEQSPTLLGLPVQVGFGEAEAVAQLRLQLLDLTGGPVSGVGDTGHAGECESVRHGVMLRDDGTDVVVLCANDHGAKLLASANALASRNMHTVLVEMATESRIADGEVESLYARMSRVTRLALQDRPDFDTTTE